MLGYIERGTVTNAYLLPRQRTPEFAPHLPENHQKYAGAGVGKIRETGCFDRSMSWLANPCSATAVDAATLHASSGCRGQAALQGVRRPAG